MEPLRLTLIGPQERLWQVVYSAVVSPAIAVILLKQYLLVSWVLVVPLIVMFLWSLPVRFARVLGAGVDTLEIDDEGVTYTSALPRWLPGAERSWHVAKDEIRRIMLRRPAGQIVPGELVLESTGVRRELLLAHWYPDFVDDQERALSLERRFERVEQSTLVQRFKALGLPVDRDWASCQEIPARLIVLIVGAFVLVIMGAGAANFDENFLPGDKPVHLISAITLLIIWLTGRWLGGRMPKGEAFAIACLFGVIVYFSTGPFLLRMNAAGNGGLVTEAEYRVVEPGTLSPVAKQLPTLTFSPRSHPYWSKLGSGTPYFIRIRHGLLGIWQYDERTVEMEIERALDVLKRENNQSIHQ